MWHRLKWYSLYKMKGRMIISFLLGILMFAMCGQGLLLLLHGAEQMEDIPIEELENRYVKAEVCYVLDWYARTDYSDGSVAEKEYIIPVGDQEYMGLVMPGTMLEQADWLQEATKNYLEKGQEIKFFLQVEGTVRPLEGESLFHFQNLLQYDQLSPQHQAQVCPLALYVGDVGAMPRNLTIFFSLAGAICIFVFAFFLGTAIFGFYQRSVKKFCDENPEMERALEEFCKQTPLMQDVRMNEEFLMLYQGPRTIMLDPAHIVWAYGRISWIFGKTFHGGEKRDLFICRDDGTKYCIRMKKEQVDWMMQALAHQYSNWIFGYSEQLEQLYRQDPAFLTEHFRDTFGQIVETGLETDAEP